MVQLNLLSCHQSVLNVASQTNPISLGQIKLFIQGLIYTQSHPVTFQNRHLITQHGALWQFATSSARSFAERMPWKSVICYNSTKTWNSLKKWKTLKKNCRFVGCKFRLSLDPGPSRARYFPRDMLLLTTTARERAWRLLKITSPLIGWFDGDSPNPGVSPRLAPLSGRTLYIVHVDV